MVNIEPGLVTVNGPKGELHERVATDLTVEKQDSGEILVTRPTDRGEHRALHGLTRSLISNMVVGVTDGFEKCAGDPGRRLPRPAAGHASWCSAWASRTRSRSRPREGIEFEVPSPTEVEVKGASKQLVGETAARIRKQRPPEPYKGKGVRYKGEYVARKVGKRA